MKNFAPLAGGIAYAVMLTAPVYAADLDLAQEIAACAVSGPNGKLEGAGGSYHGEDGTDDGSRYHGAVSLSMPLGCDFGLQVDGLAGHLGDESTWSIGGHLFTRDPSTHLFGIYGEYTEIGNNTISRLAAEGELYLDQITLSGIAGVEDSDLTNNDFFGAAQLGFYATDNFQLNLGVANFLDVTAVTFGAEWQPDGSNMSLFAQGAAGDNDHSTVYGGIRIYFGGEQKSLIRRHREDDPLMWSSRLQRLIEVDECPPGFILITPMEGPAFCADPSVAD